jgi:2Fe-2S ferredoxin
MPQVTFIAADGTSTSVEAPLGENVMRVALYNGIDGIIGECGGGLSCATCHCYIDQDWTDRVGPPSSQVEDELLESAGAAVKPTSRLSCQIEMTEALDGLVVHLPETQY